MIKTKKKGLLIVISGPSGCGKDTVVKEVLKKNKSTWLSISCTSRDKRSGEVDNKDYYFLSKSEFEKKIKNNELLEYAKYTDNYYGTPKEHIKEKLDSGIDVILVIEIEGALKIKELLPETIFIFILPPSMRELKRRLEGRKTESKEKITKRFIRAYEEINEVTKYNYVVVNDEIDTAANKINAILIAERSRVDRIEQVFLNNPEEEMHEILLEDEKDFSNKLINIDIEKESNLK